ASPNFTNRNPKSVSAFTKRRLGECERVFPGGKNGLQFLMQDFRFLIVVGTPLASCHKHGIAKLGRGSGSTIDAFKSASKRCGKAKYSLVVLTPVSSAWISV
ncbi:MAG: hypothetical protein AAF802_24695, partial [Planctomycetota bacterium]